MTTFDQLMIWAGYQFARLRQRWWAFQCKYVYKKHRVKLDANGCLRCGKSYTRIAWENSHR